MKFNQWIGVVALSATPVIVNATAYDLQELPVTDLSLNQYASSIDNTGLILTTLTNPFNQPIDMDIFDVANFPSLTDPDAAALGNFNLLDYSLAIGAFRQNGNNFSTFGQKLATQVIYQTDGTDVEYVSGFDQQQTGTNGFTFGLNATVAGSANGAYIVGSSPSVFFPEVYTTDAGDEITAVISDFLQRGFVQFGAQVNPLVPIDTTLSGFSRASGINNNLQVIGSSSVGVLDAITEGIENCSSEELTIPVEICLYELKARSQTQFVVRATLWQLDAQGEVISTQAYGLDFTPAEDDTRNYRNDAVAINNVGVAVGSGSVLFSNRAVSAAMVYENGETRRLLEDDALLPNFATGINDEGVITGYQVQTINGQGRAKFFTYDLNTSTLTFPNDFFVSSSTFPRDINNSGIIVGDAEVESTTQSQRRRGAFIYDPQTDDFLNLNELVACDSPYEIVSANSINDSNVIVADAVVLRAAKNARGEVFIDADGNEILETAVVAVKLTPNGGDAPNCDEVDEENPNEVRQGAASSLFLLTIMFTFAVFRRFKRTL